MSTEPQTNDQIMSEIYFGQGAGAFSGFESFYKSLPKTISHSEALDYYKNNSVTQTNKPVKRDKFTSRHFLVSDVAKLMLSDSVFLPPSFSAYRYYYIYMDALSKKTSIKFQFTAKLTGENAIKGLEEAITQLNFPLKGFKLMTDKGSDYTSLIFKSWTKARDIDLYYSTGISPHKVSPCERKIRTLRNLTNKIRRSIPRISLIDAIKRANKISNENPTLESGLAPNELTPENSYEELLALERKRAKEVDKMYGKTKKIPSVSVFNIGDRVRCRNPKQAFTKELQNPTYSLDVYTVVKILKTSPKPSYYIQNDSGHIFGSYPPSYLLLVERGSDGGNAE